MPPLPLLISSSHSNWACTSAFTAGEIENALIQNQNQSCFSTKYMAGHTDIIGGCLSYSSAELGGRLVSTHHLLGSCMVRIEKSLDLGVLYYPLHAVSNGCLSAPSKSKDTWTENGETLQQCNGRCTVSSKTPKGMPHFSYLFSSHPHPLCVCYANVGCKCLLSWAA